MAHQMNKEPTNPYTDGRFWRAYASLYWPDLNDNAELASFAKSVADGLPERQPGEPIRILALGFGFGGVELPILHYLKRITGAPLECVVIDKEAEPLRFAEILLENGIENIPLSTAEIYRRFEEFPKPKEVTSAIRERWNSRPTIFPGGDSFHFIQDDLDWEPLPDGSPLPVCPEPSHWDERLTATHGVSSKFHLVFVSFCLFHIGWWQRAVYASLGLLVENGVFLHGRVEGDEALFEGRPGKKTNRNKNATTIFGKGFFENRLVVNTLKTPRDASASRPFVIEEYLARLESFGLNRLGHSDDEEKFRYTVTNIVENSVYKDLLKTRGFSTFRRISEQLETAYDSVCDEAFKQVELGKADQLEIDFIWSVHKVSPKALKGCPLHPLFRLEATWEVSQKALAGAYQTEYALNGASSIHNELGDDDHALLARTIGEKLNQQALLHSDCVALQFGFIPRGVDRPEFFYAPNYSLLEANIRERQVRELTLYLSIIKRSGTNSNTQTLLDVALQEFSKPCIFVYYLGAKEFRVEHRPARDYEEIRFYVPTAPADTLLELNKQRHTWMNSIKRIPIFEGVHDLKTRIVFTLDDFELSKEGSDEAMANLFAHEYDISAITITLRDQIDKMETLEPETISALKETITDSSVFRSICLQFLSDTKLIVFYPASYEVAGTSSGRDLVIVSYRSDLTDASIESDFHKFNQIFEKVRFARQEMDVNIRTMQITSHESKNIAATLLKWPVEICKGEGNPILSAPADSPWHDLIANDQIALLPHPMMYRNILKTHILWTMANSVDDLPFDKPYTIEELVTRCWDTVFLGFQAYVYKSLDAINPKSAEPYRLFLDSLRKLFKDPPFQITNKGTESFHFDWKGNQWRLINLGRMLVCYFREYIQHADWSYPSVIIYHPTENDDFEFSICNRMQPGDKEWRAEREKQLAKEVGLGDAEQKVIFKTARAQNEQQFVFDPDRTPRGKEVIKLIATQLHDENKGTLEDFDKINNEYCLHFLFSTKRPA